MFRTIRKQKNAIGIGAAKALLSSSRRGVLAMNGDDGYPYAIPINYWYNEAEEKIVFHGSKTGHKVEALKASDKVCFTVYGGERVEDEPWAPFVQSVVVFGRCRIVDSVEENIRLVQAFARKYYPCEAMITGEIAKAGHAVQMFEISIEHLSAKEVQER